MGDYVICLCACAIRQSTLQGYNVSIISYGQTGSGKTHTMQVRSPVQSHPNTIAITPFTHNRDQSVHTQSLSNHPHTQSLSNHAHTITIKPCTHNRHHTIHTQSLSNHPHTITITPSIHNRHHITQTQSPSHHPNTIAITLSTKTSRLHQPQQHHICAREMALRTEQASSHDP